MTPREHQLSGSPSMVGLFARAGLAAIPGAAALPFVAGGGGRIRERALVLADRRIDRDRLAGYARVCGYDVGEVLPPTYPHVLAFPLQLSLMTEGSFPVSAAGLVHVANRIVQHRPIRSDERLSLRVWATPLQPHPRGRQFTLRSEAWVGVEKVWEEASLNLARGRRDESVPAPDGPPDSTALPQAAVWRLPGDLGRRYGSVSGDRNPIHIHPLTARLFGFPTAIAHGMWTTARCLAQLGTSVRRVGGESFSVEVAFRAPIRLPATVVFAEGADGGSPGAGGLAFGVRDARTGGVHLDGLLTAMG